MTEDRLSGLLLAIPLLAFIYILMVVDKHYLNNRIASLFKNRTFRIGFMVLLLITVMLSNVYWRAYISS